MKVYRIGIISIFCCYRLFAAHDTPNDLALRWIKAVNSKSSSEFAMLIHPNCPVNKIHKKFMKNLSSGEIPKNSIEVKVTPFRKHLLSKSLKFFVTPHNELKIKVLSKTPMDRQRYGLGRMAYIGKEDQKWYIIPCIELLKQNRFSLPEIKLNKGSSEDWKWEWALNFTQKMSQEFKFKIVAQQGKAEKVLIDSQEIQPSSTAKVRVIFRVGSKTISTTKDSISISYGFTRIGEKPYGLSNWIQFTGASKVELSPFKFFNLGESRIRLINIENSDDDNSKVEIFLLKQPK